MSSYSELVGTTRYGGLTIALEVLVLIFSQKLVVSFAGKVSLFGLKVELYLV